MRIEDSAEQTHNHTDLHTPNDNKTAEDRLAALRALKQGLPPPNCGFMTLPLELRLMVYRDGLITTSNLSQRVISHYIMGWQENSLPRLLNVFPGLRPEALHTLLEVNCVKLEPFFGIFSLLTSYEMRHGLQISDEGCSRLRHAVIDFKLTPLPLDAASQNLILSMKALKRCINLKELTIRFGCDIIRPLWRFQQILSEVDVQHGLLKASLPRRKMLTLSLEIMDTAWSGIGDVTVIGWLLMDLLGLEKNRQFDYRHYRGHRPMPKRMTEDQLNSARAKLEQQGGMLLRVQRPAPRDREDVSLSYLAIARSTLYGEEDKGGDAQQTIVS